MASLAELRAQAVAALMRQYDHVDPEFVMVRLGCGRGQALKAIRQGRFLAADDGYRVSYADATNGYIVALEGDTDERLRSYFTRQRSINTQRHNAARVMKPEGTHPSATRIGRALSKMASADEKQAEVDRLRLELLYEALGNGTP